jgi:hypothetical protein
VLQTSELLEDILVHLPARNIFGVQRVSKSFRNVIESSVPIQQKLFRRKRQDPETKVMAYGCQHTAALLNPLFVAGAIPGDRTVQNKPLAGRDGACERFGITMERQCRIPMDSSILDTYLLHVPFRKLKMSLVLWVGKDGPAVIIDDADVGAGNGTPIRAMIHSVLEKEQKLGVAYNESLWRGAYSLYPTPGVPLPGDPKYRVQYYNDRLRRWGIRHDDTSFWKQREADRKRFLSKCSPEKMLQGLWYARGTGSEQKWGCDMYGKPGEILRHLQESAGHGSEVYVSLNQRPTLWLHDVVIPATSDWVSIMAKNS